MHYAYGPWLSCSLRREQIALQQLATLGQKVTLQTQANRFEHGQRAAPSLWLCAYSTSVNGTPVLATQPALLAKCNSEPGVAEQRPFNFKLLHFRKQHGKIRRGLERSDHKF